MRDFLSDLRYAARMLAKNPGFTAIAVFALALGIGANTAIFSVVNAVLLRPLPFADAARLMAVNNSDSRRDDPPASSYPDFRDYRAMNHTLQNLVAYHDDAWALTGAGREAVILQMGIVSADMFPMLGFKPLLGRTFRADEDENLAASPMTIVLSHKTWQADFASDPNAIGRIITLRGLPYMVIGVMPPAFNFPVRSVPYDAWTTFAFSADMRSESGTPMASQRGACFLTLIGKVKSGVRAAQAQADLAVINSALSRKYPGTNQYRGVKVAPLLDQLVGKLRPVLLLLLGAVCCVLLVACANVANLLLARAGTRRREIAIRSALGAGRARVIRQLLTESVLLSLMGGAVGLLLGVWGNDLLVRFSPVDVPRLGEASIDGWVFLFALGVSLLTGIVFGLPPALRASQSGPAEALKEGSRGSTEGIRSNKARSVLVVSEIALALMLLACAGLLLKSLSRLASTPPGFQTHGVLSASLNFPEAKYTQERFLRVLDAFEVRLRQLPGVTSAGDVLIVPLSGNDMVTGVEIEGRPEKGPERPRTRINMAGAGYFQAMGIPLRAGRDFNERDTDKSKDVVVINQVFADQILRGQNPIGKRVRPGFGKGAGEPPMREIVGVVGAVEQDRIGEKPLPELFIPRDQFAQNQASVIVNTRTDSRAIVPAFRSTLRAMDPDLAIDDLRTMDERIALSVAQPRFQSFLLAIFAAVALLLTAVGLYGVISYSVAQRTHEIGTRMALGARRGNILRLVVGQGMLLAVAGVVVGLGGALLITRALQSMLYEVAPNDPFTLLAVAAVVMLTALLATVVPAMRAANVDPMTALRYE